jgi:formylmethanofuran dehydrogenase subunit B
LPQTIDDVACTQCGCVCDDLKITFEGERIVSAERACGAEPFYRAQERGCLQPQP